MTVTLNEAPVTITAPHPFVGEYDDDPAHDQTCEACGKLQSDPIHQRPGEHVLKVSP
jgi:hypothetical protein